MRRRVRFLAGPIFHNLILADEINRTPPKTQAALLQAMQERRVTVGTTTHRLPDPFQVFATRNPIEQEGTYPLPEAQLDRFLLEIHIDYPSRGGGARDRAAHHQRRKSGTSRASSRADDVRALQGLVPRIPGDGRRCRAGGRARPRHAPEGRRDRTTPEEVREYVRFGAGPRGSQALVLAAKARAALLGQAAADVDDIRALVIPVLRHRLVLSYRAEAEGVTRRGHPREGARGGPLGEHAARRHFTSSVTSHCLLDVPHAASAFLHTGSPKTRMRSGPAFVTR